MEEDRAYIISNLMSELKSMDLNISIVIFGDMSGHLEEENGFSYKRIKNSEFYGMDSLVSTLATEVQKRNHREKYVENILARFVKKIIK